MEFQQLRGFVTVADEGSFTRAALVLQVTQPSLSQAVAKLEGELGVRLLHRSPRGVSLTGDGEVFLRSARQVLHSVDDAHATAAGIRGVTAGSLTVMSLRIFTTAVAEFNARFLSTYPGVVLRVHSPAAVDDMVYALVDSGECDIGFTRRIETQAAIDFHQVAVDESVAVLPRSSPQGLESGPITLAEVAELPLIMAPLGSSMRIQTEHLFAVAHVPVRVAMECDHHESSIELARVGVGAYITTRGGLPGRADEIVTVRPLAPARLWPIGLIHRTDYLSPAAKAYIELILEGSAQT